MRLFVLAPIALAACAAPIQPSILGFDGAVVKVGIANQGDQLVSTLNDRIAGTRPRAVEFCKSKGFTTAELQQEVTKETYGLGPKFDHIAYLCID